MSLAMPISTEFSCNAQAVSTVNVTVIGLASVGDSIWPTLGVLLLGPVASKAAQKEVLLPCKSHPPPHARAMSGVAPFETFAPPISFERLLPKLAGTAALLLPAMPLKIMMDAWVELVAKAKKTVWTKRLCVSLGFILCDGLCFIVTVCLLPDA